MIAHRLRRLALALASLVVASAPAAAMTFQVVPYGDALRCGDSCPQVIRAEGRIDGDTAEQFVQFARSAMDAGRLQNVVFIHSPGGSVVGSVKLGAVFRSLGTTVIVGRVRPRAQAQVEVFQGRGGRQSIGAPTADLVNGTCNSACVYAVMGGKRRVIPPQSSMGIHRMQAEVFHGLDVASGRAVFEKLKGSTEQVDFLRRYARYMGVDPALVSLAESVSHDDIKVLSRQEVRRFRLGREKF
jgi:hypothetical protein